MGAEIMEMKDVLHDVYNSRNTLLFFLSCQTYIL